MSTLTPQNPVPPRSVNVPVRRLAIRRQGRYNVSNTKPSCSGPGTLVLHHHEPPSLPCEILQAIFTEAVRPSSADIDLEETILLRSTILGCSQVCQIWRLAARDYSLLWIHAIDPRKHSPEVVADLLELSRPHLIEVGHRSAPFFITTERHCNVLLKFRPHRGRIREWNVFLSPSLCPLANTRWIFGSLGWASSRCIRILRWSGAITSPGGALSTISSSLFKLELRNTNLVLPQWIDLSNLTELSVHSKALNSIKLSLQEWFVLLKGTYRLRFLGLHHAMKTDNELDAAMGQLPDDVTLPELQLCSLTESSWDGAFMAFIVFLVINKPFTCGLQLDLPRWADLVDEDGGNDLNADEIKQTIGVVATSFQEYAGHHTSDTLPGVTPRVEISVKYENPGIQVTFGTVPNPATTLDWNGYRGAAGVEQYLDSYFGSPIHASSPRHPPISVTLYNPNDADMHERPGDY
ncbi:hypothetical protein FA13DRAFT_1716401 [Coprinellus micaceus]|uniref:Uncharacterized protein n=1 Tax=Coprinellus micaceus TaxID=71717 RepID=A0A4Y7SJE1_COPMI|nr:hypothetical protein FA13DRAFT_1716401 [Coprinellus micaceus]